MLEQKTIDIVKDTVPVLKERGIELTQLFYKTMFENNPEVKPLFDISRQNSGEQPKLLAMAILAAAENIDNLEVMIPAVKNIGLKHVAANIKPEHYPIVGKNLLLAMEALLNPGVEVIEAWAKAYTVISDIFIKMENEIYNQVN